MTLGRADLGDFVCFMNLDVRNGRTNKQKRELAIKYMEGVKEILGIKLNNQYVTLQVIQEMILIYMKNL